MGPTIVAAWRSSTGENMMKRRGYLLAMFAAFVANMLYWAWLFSDPDPQNGIGIILFPIAQYGALAFCVVFLERAKRTDLR